MSLGHGSINEFAVDGPGGAAAAAPNGTASGGTGTGTGSGSGGTATASGSGIADGGTGTSTGSGTGGAASAGTPVLFEIEVTFPVGVTPGTVAWIARHLVGGVLTDVGSWSTSGVAATPSMTAGASQPAGYTISSTVLANNADGSFSGIILTRSAATSATYDVQELNTQATSKATTRRVSKVPPLLSTDVFTTLGSRLYENDAGTVTALETRTTSGIVAIPEISNGYVRDITVDLAGTEFKGFVLWDMDATTYLQDSVKVQRSVNETAGTTRTLTAMITSDGTTPLPSLSGLKWAFYDAQTPDDAVIPADSGTAASTDVSGVLTLSVNTTLPAGGVGWLDLSDSDGTTTQSPAAKFFSGPVALS